MEEQILNQLSSLHLTDRPTASQATSQSTFSREQLREIAGIVTSTLTNLNNNNNEIVTEPPTIDFSSTNAAAQSEKCPDAVKCLRQFSGKPEEFASWRKTVNRILQMYQSYKDTPKYFAVLHMIRQKVVGDADVALESYRTPLDWGQIKKCLMMHYSDKRVIGTLEYQITVMTQGNDPVNLFDQRIYQHLSLILNKVDCLNVPEETLMSLANTYREKALDTFIRGLNGDLPRLLSIKEPTSLPQALHMCLKLDNMTYRWQHAHTSNSHVHPKLPPKPHFNRPIPPPPRHFNNRPFYPELVAWPRPSFNQQQQFVRNNTPWSCQNGPQNFNTQPPLPPKPQPRPVPMSVDESIRSAQLNYQNRPNITPFHNQGFRQHAKPNFDLKRQASQRNVVQPVKMQRNYHIHSEEYPYSEEYQCDYYTEESCDPSDWYSQNLQQYSDTQETANSVPVESDPENIFASENEVPHKTDDVNFLGL